MSKDACRNDHIFRLRLPVALILMCCLLQSCSDVAVKDSAPKPKSVNIDSIPDAVPRPEPKSKYGNPESYEVFGKRYYVMNDSNDFTQKGIASWYGKKFHGRRTSNGETYDMYAMTAAHKSLSLPTYVEVTNLKNNRQIVVRVNDRGPFHENRIIDLSYTAARKLDIVKNGTAEVKIRALAVSKPKVRKESEVEGYAVRTALKEGTANSFYIQVGAFSSAKNAQQLQNRLTTLSNKPIEISEAKIEGKTVYRVQIGPLYSIDAADNIVTKLGTHGINEHKIVVR